MPCDGGTGYLIAATFEAQIIQENMVQMMSAVNLLMQTNMNSAAVIFPEQTQLSQQRGLD